MFPLVMGVVNVTPDSFSDGGRFTDAPTAVAHAERLIAAGADVIDIGGESTRPGATPVDVETELARVLPVIGALAGRARLSIDTMKPEVADAALSAGATMLNDVSGSPGLAAVAARHDAAWVCMHMQGTPRTMQADPHYDDVVAEVHDWLVERADAARGAGVREVWIDPGIGFGKTCAHNLALLGNLEVLVATGLPVVVGTSRKSFLGRLLADAEHRSDPVPIDRRLVGSIATAVTAMAAGAGMVRVHDVAATVAARALVVGHAQVEVEA